MRIIAVENSPEEVNYLRQTISAAFPDSDCESFLDPFLAIKSYLASPADFAVFCRHMRIIDGFTFARILRSRQAEFTGVMLAQNPADSLDAEKFFLGYLVKPYDAADLKRQYEQLRQIRRE